MRHDILFAPRHMSDGSSYMSAYERGQDRGDAKG